MKHLRALLADAVQHIKTCPVSCGLSMWALHGGSFYCILSGADGNSKPNGSVKSGIAYNVLYSGTSQKHLWSIWMLVDLKKLPYIHVHMLRGHSEVLLIFEKLQNLLSAC